VSAEDNENADPTPHGSKVGPAHHGTFEVKVCSARLPSGLKIGALATPVCALQHRCRVRPNKSAAAPGAGRRVRDPIRMESKRTALAPASAVRRRLLRRLPSLAGDQTAKRRTEQTQRIDQCSMSSKPKETTMYIGGGFIVLLIVLFLVFR